MKRPRIRIADVMIVVAILALDLGAIRASVDGTEEGLLLDALPTVNILVFVGIAGFRRRRLRAFALGFEVVGSLSLLSYLWWTNNNPWAWLCYFGPPITAVARRVEALFPHGHLVIIYIIYLVAFAIPHTVLGLCGGYLTAKGWAKIGRRKSA
jgi:hypothetical protein